MRALAAVVIVFVVVSAFALIAVLSRRAAERKRALLHKAYKVLRSNNEQAIRAFVSANFKQLPQSFVKEARLVLNELEYKRAYNEFYSSLEAAPPRKR